MEQLINNVKDVALIFEGGGMRNSYSSAVVSVLLENNIYFDAVFAVSAGASNAINYVSRDLTRSRLTFTEYADDIPFRKLEQRVLNSGLLGEHTIRHFDRAGSKIPFDFDTFQANPAQLTLVGLDRDTGATTYWNRSDFTTEEQLAKHVSATLSYPIIMSPTKLACAGADVGRGPAYYYDGGPAEGGGIMVPRARHDGYRKYFVVCTQHRGFRKKLGRKIQNEVFFWHRPEMRKALADWARKYNEQLDGLLKLEACGQAYVFYAEEQSVINRELDSRKLKDNYERGYLQAQRELDSWIRFLGL